MQPFSLDGKLALVTRASRGIGLGAAKAMAEAGARVTEEGSAVGCRFYPTGRSIGCILTTESYEYFKTRFSIVLLRRRPRESACRRRFAARLVAAPALDGLI